MARPRRDPDDTLLDRIASALAARTDVSPWTLAEIAPAAGLSPAGLVKRFGSRKGVLLALSDRWLATIPREPQQELPPVDELRNWVRERFSPPQDGAQGLSQLIDDLVDDDLRDRLREGWRREQVYLAALLGANRLPGVHDPSSCAAILFDALNGAALRAAAGDPDPVQRTLDTLLELWT